MTLIENFDHKYDPLPLSSGKKSNQGIEAIGEMKEATVGWRWLSNDVGKTLDSSVVALYHGENYGVVTWTGGVRSRGRKRTYPRKSSLRRTTECWSEGGRCAKGRQNIGLPTRLVGGVVMVSGPVIHPPREGHDYKPKGQRSNAEDSSAAPSLHYGQD